MSHNLMEIARFAMISRGLEPDFSDSAVKEASTLSEKSVSGDERLPDLTGLPWCSIDNDDSQDFDQITVCEKVNSGAVKVFVGLADVSASVKLNDPIDQHARHNTTSIYTAVRIFPMLPEKLSTNLTSLSEGKVRNAVVIEMLVNKSGEVASSKLYRARVLNHAKLAYNSVSAWLESNGPMPEGMQQAPELQEQIRAQDQVAQLMRAVRYQNGALDIETIEPKAIMEGDRVVDLQYDVKNRARELIEDFMIAANGVTARFLTNAGYPTLRRVVRSPDRWARIIDLVKQFGEVLPQRPDSKALSAFLAKQRAKDALRFPDLSLAIVKLLGRGEYILEMASEEPLGHFGLAVRDYTHSTAPNRRFPDLITQRLLKSALSKEPSPYSVGELNTLASHCTQQEDAADKVERQVRKSASALFLKKDVGKQFDAIVTGASDKGTFARVLHPPVEGMVVRGQRGLDVGDKVRLKLVDVDVERGFIDFAKVN